MTDQIRLNGIGFISSSSIKTGKFFIRVINEVHMFKIRECRVMDKFPNTEENSPNDNVAVKYPHLHDLKFSKSIPGKVEFP